MDMTILEEAAQRRLIRNQAIERALTKHLRKTLSGGFVDLFVTATLCDGLRVTVTTRHGTRPITELTTIVQQVLAKTKIKMLGVKLSNIETKQMYQADIFSF